MILKKHILIAVLVGLSINLLLLGFHKTNVSGIKFLTSLIERMELTTIDWRYQYKARENFKGTVDNILQPITMDDTSDLTLQPIWGMHPYSRELYARLVDFLDRHHANLIAFDLLFELDHEGSGKFVESLRNFKGIKSGATILTNRNHLMKGQTTHHRKPMFKPVYDQFTQYGHISLTEFEKNFPDGIVRKLSLVEPVEDENDKESMILGALLTELYLKRMLENTKDPSKKDFFQQRLDYLEQHKKADNVYLDWYFIDFDFKTDSGVTFSDNHGLTTQRLDLLIQEDSNERGILALKHGDYAEAEKYFKESLLYSEWSDSNGKTTKEAAEQRVMDQYGEFEKEAGSLKLEELKIPETPENDRRPTASEQLIGMYLSRYLKDHPDTAVNIDEYLLVEDEFERNLLKGKNFILAPWSVSYQDMYQCPTGKIRGVELHTTVFQNIMDMSFCKRFDTGFGIMINFIIAIVVAVGLYLTGILRSMALSLISGVVLLIAVFFGIVWVFMKWGVFLEIVPFMFQSVVTVVLLSSVKYLFEYKEQKKVKGILGKYVSPDLAAELIKNPDSLRLGGREIVGSVIFMDVCSFTSMSEKLEAVEVISLLNRYFEKINQIIFDTGGMLDKFIGDAVMALYGVFSNDDMHARNAIKACLDIKSAIRLIKAEPELKFSFGINTGKMVCGNLGSSIRQEFTAIGDTVNTAARLEGVATVDEICVGSATYELSKDYFEFEGPLYQKVKGKEKEVKFYKVTGYKTHKDE